MWVLVTYLMLLKSNSSTAPRSDAASASRARVVRYVRSRSTFQRSSQSTFIEPGEAIGDITTGSPMQVRPWRVVPRRGKVRSSMLHSDETGASQRRTRQVSPHERQVCAQVVQH